ncbi:hypothetical protein [uncultured Aquimarina sp.]|uniref:hypothetical protein n=1 Tax=uncultured Aquimarina sp. TaxID=575652 RepID=UPI00262C727B|nr:hypothetical protein [uncultured Aquimarina sp.]
MDFRNIKEAKEAIIEYIELYSECSKRGDYKGANKNVKKILSTKDFIEENYGLETLKDLLDSDDDKILVWIAKFLLPIYEEISIAVLEKVIASNIPDSSFSAEMIMKEWRKNQ